MPPATSRLLSIDALRGLVILLMLLDHVRETFFLHLQLSDPMALEETAPLLYAGRLLSHLCAPVFVLLTGLSAALYGQRHGGRAAVSRFLFTRGLFLVVLELSLVNLAWTFQFPPQVIYLQVIWAIGLSMLVLALLVHVPRAWLVLLGIVLVAGHNLLDGWSFASDSPWHLPWAILHERGWLEWGELRVRTSYPVLPWIGVIALGYVLGDWYRAEVAPPRRQQRLFWLGLGCLGLFVLLRGVNLYGDQPRLEQAEPLLAWMSFFNLTKYPPSLLFLAFNLGLGLLLLAAFERPRLQACLPVLATYGAVPMFFYLLHLYVLKGLYLALLALHGRNQGNYFGFDALWWLPLLTLLLAVVLYWPVRAFAALKARRRDLVWLKYF